MPQNFTDNVYDPTFVVDTTMANVEHNFAALKTSFSGPHQPPNMLPGMWWYDTTAKLLKLRNEANTAWQNTWDFSAGRVPTLALGTGAADHTTWLRGDRTWQPIPAGVTWPLLAAVDGTAAAPAYSWSANANMGIRRGGVNDLRFVTAGVDRMIISSEGNIGVGVAPIVGYRQHVAGNTFTAGAVRALAGIPSAGGSNAGFCFAAPDGGPVGVDFDGGMFSNADGTLLFFTDAVERVRMASGATTLQVSQGGSTQIRIRPHDGAINRTSELDFWSTFGSGTDTGARRTARITCGFGGGAWGTECMVFGVGGAGDLAHPPTVRMQLTGTGLGIGTAPTHQLRLSLDSAAKPGHSTWTVVSDRRLKEQIVAADLQRCYENVKRIPLWHFRWRDDALSHEQVRDRGHLGWISDEVLGIFPKSIEVLPFEMAKEVEYEEWEAPAETEEGGPIEAGSSQAPGQNPEKVLVKKRKKEVLEDCKYFNADQIYASLYGCVQYLIQQVEELKTQVGGYHVTKTK